MTDPSDPDASYYEHTLLIAVVKRPLTKETERALHLYVLVWCACHEKCKWQCHPEEAGLGKAAEEAAHTRESVRAFTQC